VRRSFDDATHGPRRCAGATYYSYWHTFVGNVLGYLWGTRDRLGQTWQDHAGRTTVLDVQDLQKHYQITKAFLERPERMLNELLRPDDPSDK